MKVKAHKQSKEGFINHLLSQEQGVNKDLKSNLFYITLKVCLFENQEPFENPEVQFTFLSSLTHPNELQYSSNEPQRKDIKQFDSKQFARLYEEFLDKLQFADEVIHEAKESNFSVIYLLVSEGVLQNTLERLICSGNSKVRLKAMDILRSLTELFVLCKDFKISHEKIERNAAHIIEDTSATFVLPDFDFGANNTDKESRFTTTKLIYCRFALPIIKMALEQFQDPKIQFYALALLAKIFDNFLPALKVSEEIEKFNSTKKQIISKKIDISEFENINCFANLDVKKSYSFQK